MTNEQKATEIANQRESEFGEIRDINGCCYMSALDMAVWKDNQCKTELERLMNRFHGEESHKAYFSIETLQELYNNLFQNVIEPL
jgi:hypothetical protein